MKLIQVKRWVEVGCLISSMWLFAGAQSVYGQATPAGADEGRSDLTNPIRVLEDATRALPNLLGQGD